MNNQSYQVVVLGAGESGVGAALLCRSKGVSVFVSDFGTISPKYREELETNSIPYEEGQHTEELILACNEVVKSPGIPDKAPIVKHIRAKGIPIISEIELATRYTSACIIGITGSNGKTTTTMWLHHILSIAELNPVLAGNVGFSLARCVAEPNASETKYYVVELSSFQLDGMYSSRVNLALLMNITPDHLDRYNYNFEEYALSKMRILQNQTESDSFIYWGEDEFISRYVSAHQPMSMQTLAFHTYPQIGAAADRSDDNVMRVRVDGRSFEFSIANLALQGPHNIQNAMAVTIAAMKLGVSDKALCEGLTDFVNVPHRLERIAVVNGVAYINDSKATNVSSTYYALRTMTTPYILILGGVDKGGDYKYLNPMLTSGARALIFLGIDHSKLHAAFDGLGLPIVEVRSMADAILQARCLAQSGDTVLLSPACSSFDLFASYEERGNLFRTEVLRLKEQEER